MLFLVYNKEYIDPTLIMKVINNMSFRLHFKNFKSLWDVDFEPGMVNVFIGANGSGKSALLEAIGVLSAAMAGSVDDASLQQRGVRLGTPSLYKSSFRNHKIPLTIQLGIDWENPYGDWKYNVHLSNPIDKPKPAWQYHAEKLHKGNKSIFGRSGNTKHKIENFPEVEVDSYKGLLNFLQGIHIENNPVYQVKDLYNTFSHYAIYTPNTSTLRGIQSDSSQREPVGLFGGRLSEAVEDLLNLDEEKFGNLELDELYELLDWVGDLSIGKPNREILSPSVPTTQKIIRFTDAYMNEKRNELTPYDASEGSLYVLFLLTLAMHASSSKMFAIDNFDQALNPRLARAVTKQFSQQVIESGKIAFITTHNPTTLDGLNLRDERIRLFSVNRNIKGHTQVTRITVTDELLEMGKQGYSLSRLWVMGRLGGVPNIWDV
ncbi:hypothetical protein ADA01nite_39360 [Aneurinibacillus danicus]|uniref:ATPase AAA-type core domain-containing protein n=2 Tax=Aneurinibacillus danicus TaxID=267746 RepID=A0A511VC45_9BACL|nr:hypothetical protein ADA01nite_39360 [Aneurinibacillus danicus]